MRRSASLRGGILLEQLERPQAAPSRNVGQIGITRSHHILAGRATRHCPVWRGTPFTGNRPPDEAGGRLESPDYPPGTRIGRHELAGEPAGEHEPPRGHERAREVWARKGYRPF